MKPRFFALARSLREHTLPLTGGMMCRPPMKQKTKLQPTHERRTFDESKSTVNNLRDRHRPDVGRRHCLRAK
jgi:hypothetical protein